MSNVAREEVGGEKPPTATNVPLYSICIYCTKSVVLPEFIRLPAVEHRYLNLFHANQSNAIGASFSAVGLLRPLTFSRMHWSLEHITGAHRVYDSRIQVYQTTHIRT